LVSTDYRTTALPSLADNGVAQPGGRIDAGNYDAHIYSVNATLSPWRRLHWSATLSYSQSRIVSGVNNYAQVVPYEGDVYSVISSATFVVSQKTDLHATYSFSMADYGQPITGANLPVGIVYDRHGVVAGLTHRWKPTLMTRLQYGFFRYDEASTQRANNYDAHAIFLSLTYSME
jgi:hypothetical protein